MKAGEIEEGKTLKSKINQVMSEKDIEVKTKSIKKLYKEVFHKKPSTNSLDSEILNQYGGIRSSPLPKLQALQISMNYETRNTMIKK